MQKIWKIQRAIYSEFKNRDSITLYFGDWHRVIQCALSIFEGEANEKGQRYGDGEGEGERSGKGRGYAVWAIISVETLLISFVSIRHSLYDAHELRRRPDRSVDFKLLECQPTSPVTCFQTAMTLSEHVNFWKCSHFDQWTVPIPTVTVNEDETGQSPTDERQGMYRISKRPMYDSNDEDVDDDSKRTSNGISCRVSIEGSVS